MLTLTVSVPRISLSIVKDWLNFLSFRMAMISNGITNEDAKTTNHCLKHSRGIPPTSWRFSFSN